MKLDSLKIQNWLIEKDLSLPNISTILKTPRTDVLVVGATVFDIYFLQGWIPENKRQTSDFDLSIGLIGDDSFYEEAKKLLEQNGYYLDKEHPYRYHPAKKYPHGLQYIDLLAHPSDSKVTIEEAQSAMGVGSGFSIQSFKFASENSYILDKNVIFPNVFGMLSLKMEAYVDEPAKRIKDFADIVELVSALVDKGMHFELEEEWAKAKQYQEGIAVKQTLKKIINENELSWDIDDVRTELNKRGLSNDFIDTFLIQRIRDFVLQID